MQKKWILICSLLIIFIGYFFYHKQQLKQGSKSRIGDVNNNFKIDTAQKLLQNGDIVFRRGADGISDIFVNMNLSDKRYSHCGIYLIDSLNNGFVYHSIGGEDNPNEKIRKEKFNYFVEPTNNLAFGIYRFPLTNIQLHRLDSVVKLWYAQERTFDMDFSLTNDEKKMYCVEFVVKAMECAFQDTAYFTRSKIAIKKEQYVAPDNILLNKNAIKILEEKY